MKDMESKRYASVEQHSSVSARMCDAIDVPSCSQAYLTVNFVRPGSRGDRFGIKPHDTIVAVNNHLVFSTIDFSEAVHGKESVSLVTTRMVLWSLRCIYW